MDALFSYTNFVFDHKIHQIRNACWTFYSNFTCLIHFIPEIPFTLVLDGRNRTTSFVYLKKEKNLYSFQTNSIVKEKSDERIWPSNWNSQHQTEWIIILDRKSIWIERRGKKATNNNNQEKKYMNKRKRFQHKYMHNKVSVRSSGRPSINE